MKPKIFCFINSNSPGWVIPVALAEDGYCLASHCSSSEGWAKHDIGIGSDWKHDLYQKKYPDGFELVWLEGKDLDIHEDFKKACELNGKITETEKAKGVNL